MTDIFSFNLRERVNIAQDSLIVDVINTKYNK